MIEEKIKLKPIELKKNPNRKYLEKSWTTVCGRFVEMRLDL